MVVFWERGSWYGGLLVFGGGSVEVCWCVEERRLRGGWSVGFFWVAGKKREGEKVERRLAVFLLRGVGGKERDVMEKWWSLNYGGGV